jgi:HAD superfamily hydrolase (TIGR01509 family)
VPAIEAVLFDMDGTLVDSDAAVERTWRAWAHHHGVDPEVVFAVMHGAPAAVTARRVLPDRDDAAIAAAAAWQLEREATDLDDVVATDGARELIAALDRAGRPWAVVTSADRRLALARLGAAGIDPPVLVTVDELAAGKPDPEGYLLAARRLGIDPRACLVVEDSAVGAAAGRAAGARVAGLRGLAPPEVDDAVADLHAVTPLLDLEVIA